MNCSELSNFILAPLDNILYDAIEACSGFGVGMESYPLSDYFIQSVFLKVTGAQEQKMKSICWELATNDYGYRYEKFYKNSKMGECSQYKDKCGVMSDLVKQIQKLRPEFDVKHIKVRDIMSKAEKVIQNMGDSVLSTWRPNSYAESLSIIKSFSADSVLRDNNALFKDNTKKDKKSASKKTRVLRIAAFLLFLFTIFSTFIEIAVHIM